MAWTSVISTVRADDQGKIRERVYAVVLGGGLIFIGAVAWQLAVMAGAVDEFLTSSPVLVIEGVVKQIVSGELLVNIGISGLEFIVAFAVASVFGISLGLLMGRLRYVKYAIEPYVWLLYSSPVIALFPLIVLIFGLGAPSVVFIAIMLAIVPLIVNAMQGVDNVDPGLIKVVESFGGNELQLLRKVVLPASFPTIMAGVRLGMGRAVVGVVVGELFAGQGGIGYSIDKYASELNTTQVFSSVLIVIVAGLVLNFIARALERASSGWRTDL